MPNKNELQVLLLAAKSVFSPASTPETDSDLVLVQTFDWNKLLDLAERHRLSEVLRVFLNRLPEDAVPSSASKTLYERSLRIQAKQILLCNELTEILKLFSEQSLPALPIKGASVASSYYPDSSLREYDDLDFLILPEDLSRAITQLTQRGYQTAEKWTRFQEAHELRFQNAVELVNPNTGIIIDLHWRMLRGFYSTRLSQAQIFEEVKNGELVGAKAKLLSDEMTLLLLCLHAGKHSFAQLRWILDAACLLSKSDNLDFIRLLNLAQTSGALRMLLTGLALCQKLFDLTIPEMFERQIEKDSCIPTLLIDLMPVIQSGETPGTWKTCSFDIRMREGLLDKISYIIRRLITPHGEDWRWISLPPILSPLYYILRPIRLSLRYIVGPLWNLIGRTGRGASRFLKLPGKRKLLFLRAIVFCNAAWILLRLYPQSKLIERLQNIDPKDMAADPEAAGDIAWAIAAASARFPWTDSCLPRALSGCYLLRRAGISAKVLYGVRKENGAPQAHAWVEDKSGKVLVNEIRELETYLPVM